MKAVRLSVLFLFLVSSFASASDLCCGCQVCLSKASVHPAASDDAEADHNCCGGASEGDEKESSDSPSDCTCGVTMIGCAADNVVLSDVPPQPEFSRFLSFSSPAITLDSRIHLERSTAPPLESMISASSLSLSRHLPLRL